MTAGEWSTESRDRFTAGMVQLLEDAAGEPVDMVAGSLALTVGGSSVTGGAPIVSWRCTDGAVAYRRVRPVDVARVLRDAAEKLEAAEPAPAAWMDCQGDVWTVGADGLLETPETAPFPREHVERKWGPLRPVSAS